MPIKDDAKRRQYFRNYMAERRAGKRTAHANEIERLRAENAHLRAELALKGRVPRTVEEVRAVELEKERLRIAKRATAGARVDERPTLEKLRRVERLLAADRTRIRNLKAKIRQLEMMLEDARLDARKGSARRRRADHR